MLIDLKKYFSGENIAQQIDYTIDLSAVEIDGVKPFVSPVHVVGDLKAFASSAELNVTVQYAFSMPCNRCLKETRKEISHSISHVLVNRLNDEEDFDDYIVVEKTGHKAETQALFRLLQPFGVQQFVRSGTVAIIKSRRELLNEYLEELERNRQRTDSF